MSSNLKANFDKTISKDLAKTLGRSNMLSLPRLVKVSVSVGIGSMVTGGQKDYSMVEANMAAITGQKPALRRAKQAISNFKLREDLPVGLTITLRGERMYDFVERLVNIALPRVRDFQGISVKGFDRKGNFCLGLRDVAIFPEVNPENISKTHGMQINVCTTAENDQEAYLLLKALGFPFKDEVKAAK
jgi:large subunit ribosomal protein L5